MTNEIEKLNENTSIVQSPKQGLEALGDIDMMRRSLDEQQARIKLIHEFIDGNFREGIDYGPADPRNPKPTLLKPGAEIVCKLVGTVPKWRNDFETYKMLGEPKGTVCLICEIVTLNGEVVGEGRGAEEVGNKQRDANKAIKNAEKCAIVDAALYTFGLSGRFTQDDGGRSVTKLTVAKNELMAYVDEKRMGCDSSMSSLVFCQTVVKNYLKKSQAQTVGEVEAVKKTLEAGNYDWATGERVK